jgi:hypothetical protein
MQLKETDPDYSISHAATGNAVYSGTNLGTQFTGLNASGSGPSSVTTLAAGAVLLFSEPSGPVIGETTFTNADAVHSILAGAGNGSNFVALKTGASLGSSPQGVLGKVVAVEETATATFTASSNVLDGFVHGFSGADISSNRAYIFISNGTNAGLYKVDSLGDTDTLTLVTATPGTDITLSGTGTLISVMLPTGVSSATAITAQTKGVVYDYSVSSTLATVLAGLSSNTKTLVFGSDDMATAQYQHIDTVSDRVVNLLSNLTSDVSGKQAQVVEKIASTNFVEPSGSSVTYKIELPRVNGESTIPIATLASNLDGNSTFFANFDATANGSGNVTFAEVATVDFDGGVDADNLLVDEDLIGSTSATHSVYASYKALRVDVSDQASSPALVEITSTTDVTNLLGKISTDNPLALAAYFATLQSPSTTVKCLGVSATSTAEPSGTSAAYSSALTYLEGQDVYALACLSTDPAVQALFEAHVTSMSSASNKSERIAFVSQDMPTHSTAVLLSSGTGGNTASSFATDNTFTTNVDFSLNAALTTVLADTASDDLILVVTAKSGSTDAPTAANGVIPLKYGIRVDKSSTSTAHTTNSLKLVLNNADVESSTVGTNWNSLVDVSWSLFQMGTALTTTAQKAAAVADLGAQFANKRMFLVWPNSASASVSGTASVVSGVNLAAAWAAKVGFEKPEQAFTNLTLSGFSGLSNSNTLFSRSQLNSIAGGGTWITVQDKPNAALSCRHQLSTKVDTIQNRELSITKTVDYVAKRMRDVLEPKTGSFRITQSYLDSLGVIVEGEIRNFTETGVLTAGKVNFVEVDSTNSDTINIQVIITVPFPANYIALTLQF